MRSYRLIVILIAAFAIAGLTRPATARQNFKVKPLSERSLDRINKEGRVHYDRALYLADRVLYKQSLQSVQKAIAADPNSVALRYFSIHLSNYLGETTSGPSMINDVINQGMDATKYYDKTIENLDAILQMPKITNRQRARTAYDLQVVKKKRDGIAERDSARRAIGREIGIRYARLVYKDEYREKFEDKFDEAVDAVTGADEADEAAQAAADALTESD